MVTLTNHHSAIKMLPKAFTAYAKILTKYMEFYDTHSGAFEDFSSTLDALPNAQCICQVIDQVTQERYLRALAYDLQKSLPNY